MLLKKIKKFWKAGLVETIKDTAIPFEARVPSGSKEETNTLSSLETRRRIVARPGENDYVAVDSENQIDMAGAEQVIEFCKAVDEKKNAMLTILVIKDFGFRKFDLKAEDGNVTIVRG